VVHRTNSHCPFEFSLVMTFSGTDHTPTTHRYGPVMVPDSLRRVDNNGEAYLSLQGSPRWTSVTEPWKGPNWATLQEGRKKLTNAMINRSKPLTRWPGKTPEERRELAACFPKETTARMAVADIRAKHRAIAGLSWARRFLA
jgi:hypothetical protein